MGSSFFRPSWPCQTFDAYSHIPDVSIHRNGVRAVRWSELADREMIDIYNGARLGKIKHADMVIDPETGKITELVVNHDEGGLLSGLGRSRELRIPWAAVKQVGPQIILVEYSSEIREDFPR